MGQRYGWFGPFFSSSPYSPECVEGEFSELRQGFIRNSSPLTTMQQYEARRGSTVGDLVVRWRCNAAGF